MKELRKTAATALVHVLLNQYWNVQKSTKEPSGGSDEPAGCFSLCRSLVGLIEVMGGMRMKRSAFLSIAAE